MSNRTRLTKAKKKAIREGWPLVVYIWIFGLGLTGYFVGRLVFATRPHPLHWAMGLLGAIAGGFVGWIWYRWRGDVV